MISIHASHAGRDVDSSRAMQDTSYFNPRVPCGTRLVLVFCLCIGYLIFQSTRPMRDATGNVPDTLSQLINFNPRVPCGTRPQILAYRRRRLYFNPRVPCGTRRCCLTIIVSPSIFQSTRPMRDATHICFAKI